MPCLCCSYILHGEWVSGKNAGGCPNFPDTCWKNPHYLLEPSAPTSVFISLSQKSGGNRENDTIGFKVSGLSLIRLCCMNLVLD